MTERAEDSATPEDGERRTEGGHGPASAAVPGPVRIRRGSGPSPLAVERLAAAEPRDGSAVDAFLEEHPFPLVEGRRCTFVYRGEAERVALRHWIYGLRSSQPFERLEGTDLWVLVLELPEGSRVEYKLEVTEDGETRLIEDPLNPLKARDPFGANSVCHAQGYEVPEWTRPDSEAPEGSLEERSVRSRALSGRRRLTLYFPARFRASERYPLLVVHDGRDYLRYAGLRTVLDNLIHRKEIPPLVAALTDPRERLEEYAASDAHARFIIRGLVPSLERRLPLIASPDGRCLMGASLGAVASLHAATRAPAFFGGLLLQSGSFAFSDNGAHTRGPMFDPVVDFVDEYRSEPLAVSDKVFMSCGVYESLIYENRSMAPVLQRTEMDVRYVEALDGHNWENWRDRLREGLSWLLPGPLSLGYQ